MKFRWNRTLGGPPGTVPKLNDQPSPYEAIAPFNRHKSLQQAQLQPNSATADVRTQEHGIILRESTQGKFVFLYLTLSGPRVDDG